MEWTIRRAGPDDAPAWARCHRACWREAYGPFVDPARLEAELGEEGSWTPRVRERLGLPAGPRSWLAADSSGDVLGIAVVGPSRGDLAELTTEQLYALYVRAAWHGTGLAQALLARSLGTAAACLEVLEGNARARAFYAKHGFESTGIRQLFERFDAWEVVLQRPAQHSARPATEADVAFLTEVVIEATRAQGRFPADFDAAQEAEFRKGFAAWTTEQVRGEIPDSVTSVLMLEGQDVGRLRVVRTEKELELGGLQLLPSYQGRGIGGAILRELLAEAEASGRRFVLSVEQDNPRARSFYESSGLRVVGETERDFVMARD
jgi:ribosomal protein S18 acetylase RimI-like enzyme